MNGDHGTVASYRQGCRCGQCRAALSAAKRADVAAKKARLAAGFDPGNHGRYSTYTNWGCRCVECAAAWAAFCLNRKNERAELLAAGKVSPPHGEASTYNNYCCRCEPCLRAAHPLSPPRYPVRYVEPPAPPKVKTHPICEWLYANSAVSGPDIQAWVGHRVHLSPHPARRRGMRGWALAELDAIYPDLTVAR